LEDRAAAGRDRVAPSADDRDDRVPWQAQLAYGRAGNGVILMNDEIDQLELAARIDL
jgi:hypothetical protein